MKRLITVTAAAVMVAMFGFGGVAWASHLETQALTNGDAEGENLNGWTADAEMEAVATSDSTNITVDGAGGSFFFSSGGGSVGALGSAAMDQSVFVWGCGVENLLGDFDLSGILATDGAGTGDTAEVTLEFFNALGNLIGTVSVGPQTTAAAGGWESFGPTGSVFEGTADVTVTVEGTDSGDGDTIADAGFDNLVLAVTDCLKDFAKISGKIGARRGSFSFEGSVGTLHDAPMDLTGEIVINYKGLHQSCTFTPSAIAYPSEDVAVVTADYICDPDTSLDATATLRLVGAPGGDNNSNKDKDRGSICVDADDDDLDIGTPPCDDDGDAVALKNGNVLVDGDTTDVF